MLTLPPTFRLPAASLALALAVAMVPALSAAGIGSPRCEGPLKAAQDTRPGLAPTGTPLSAGLLAAARQAAWSGADTSPATTHQPSVTAADAPLSPAALRERVRAYRVGPADPHPSLARTTACGPSLAPAAG